ncbi:hypothetical protein TMEN_4464 [Trichophyton mentagrophytes]|uniref:Uncharacterized protein n=2 Tax=Trichophyton interdigitale TaxID=101480 RepID=A0A9P4YM48_9EURO|nr:hypothetical protein H101_04585 [Trichophyton interdigitale H6]KAF3897726.1 hypothetical protein GY631_1447 [Trichophyton interdigitale]KDB28044.1 hypothetical protein H109_00189 [Trichophyton interdigitale MR816]GBF61944.1 hypothetical protein TMEN_4464 [Trichophyton mentagrophytes]KAF3899547.1 hypothetical protein GY632_1237 [Trichophyton interdigitale]
MSAQNLVNIIMQYLTKGLHQYLPSDASMELSPQLPEPGTPVVVKLAGAKPSSQSLKHQSSAHISPPKEQWNGVVVQTPDFPLNFQVPVNAVCVRLKRSDKRRCRGETGLGCGRRDGFSDELAAHAVVAQLPPTVTS